MLQNNIEKELDLNSLNGRKEIFQVIKKSNNTFKQKVQLYNVIADAEIKITSVVEERDHIIINYLDKSTLSNLKNISLYSK